MMSARRTFTTFDGMRGTAALIVVLGHISDRWVSFHVTSAPLMVDFFFMLSGIVVANAYEDRLKTGLSVFRFAEIRIIRLYPLYIFGCAITIFYWAINTAVSYNERWIFKDQLASLAWAIFMLPRFPAGHLGTFSLNPPAWSLFFELTANLLYAVLLPYLSNRLLVIFTLVNGIFLTVFSIYYASGGFGTGGISMLPGITRIGFAFPAGVLIFRLWVSEKLPRWRVSPPAILFAMLSFSLLNYEGRVAAFGGCLVVLAIFPILLILGMHQDFHARNVPVFQYLGKISYPLYATHAPILLGTRWYGNRAGLSFLIQDLIALVIILAVAILATPLVDQPFANFLKKVSKTVSKPSTP